MADRVKQVKDTPVIFSDSANESLEQLVHSHTESLLKGALALGLSMEESKDLVQSVWLTFIEVRSSFRGQSQLRTFLFGILYNKAKERRRKTRSLVPDEQIEELVNSYFDNRGHWLKPPLDPERFTQAAETLHLIEQCLETLPLNQRTAFCLREIEDQESDEICKILDVSITNLGVLLYRAKARLRECLSNKAQGRENI